MQLKIGDVFNEGPDEVEVVYVSREPHTSLPYLVVKRTFFSDFVHEATHWMNGDGLSINEKGNVLTIVAINEGGSDA